MGIADIEETGKHSIEDILKESLTHEKTACALYERLRQQVEGRSVYLEEYARGMIGQEELHVLELRKMLRDYSHMEGCM